MFQGHPKGLYVAFASNMGERYGFYTMMAVLVLYLQARFDLSVSQAGIIYSVFYFLMYGLTLLGGWIADQRMGLHRAILWGIMAKTAGYAIMMIPGIGLSTTVAGLLITAVGNGFFKGNLQAMVGNLYENSRYRHLRDSGFSIFYMGINIGAFFAPGTATLMRNWYLNSHGLSYDSSLPAQCHQYIASLASGAPFDTEGFAEMASRVSGSLPADLEAFAHQYINVFSTGYNLAFAVAAGAMLLSLAAYVFFSKHLRTPETVGTEAGADVKAEGPTEPGRTGLKEKPELEGRATLEERTSLERRTSLEERTYADRDRQRMVALGWILLVVVFFWMSFHQNGLTMTFFARDYTVQQVDRLNYLLFDVRSVIALATVAGGLVLLLRRRLRPVLRLAGGALITGGGLALVWQYHRFEPWMTLDPEIFQQFNPIFVVACTPLVVGLFSYLNKRGKEPSAPRKIGIGMLLSAVSFLVLLFCSIGLPAPGELDAAGSPDRVSPYWLFWSYFIITWGELFLNPMGISFVSRIAPARFRGLSQGLWLCSIAVGNQLLFVGSSLWERLELWQVWFIFVACCLLSATILFALSRKFERYTA